MPLINISRDSRPHLIRILHPPTIPIITTPPSTPISSLIHRSRQNNRIPPSSLVPSIKIINWAGAHSTPIRLPPIIGLTRFHHPLSSNSTSRTNLHRLTHPSSHHPSHLPSRKSLITPVFVTVRKGPFWSFSQMGKLRPPGKSAVSTK